ncbi:MAG TPA: hypothetical protein VFY10_02095, partial [Dehalococcoidia bacterium]|nr:hypothetical protein [Dehalococcoidia bacterium]
NCNACGALVSVFVRSINSEVNGRCERCGSQDLRRRVSKFAVLGHGGGGLDDLDSLDENDPRAMAAWARRMQSEMGDEAGPEFEDMVNRLERGESLDSGMGEGLDDDF